MRSSKQKILVVDDNPDNLLVLEYLLKGSGYEVVIALDGLEALEKLKTHPIDLIISDILMPRMDGYQLCRECKSDSALKAIPFVFYTSTYTTAKDEKFARRLGVDDFIIKPVDPEELLERLKSFLQDRTEAVRAAAGSFSDEASYLTEYNRRLIDKLEQKVKSLEDEIIERSRVEEALKQSEARFREASIKAENERSKSDAVIAGMGVGISIHDTDFNILYQNNISVDTFGDHVGERCHMAYNKNKKNCDDCPMVQALKTGGIHSIERGIEKDGDERFLEITASSLKDASGKVIGGIEVTRDITRRKLMEEELRRHKENLEELVGERTAELKKTQAALITSQKMEAIGRLAGGIAHDFNNMMVAVSGLSNLGKGKIDEDDPSYFYFENIQLASDRAIKLTRQLSNIGRKSLAEPVVTDINEIIENLLKILPSFVGDDIEILSDLDPDINNVMADTGNMDQVVINLVINARDAMDSSGRLTIKTENVSLTKKAAKASANARAGRFVRLKITDDGCGMEAKVLELIYDPFYTTKAPGKGTGLGLSVVYGIVKSHNGWIEVESRKGKGTTFMIYLPVCRAKRAVKAGSVKNTTRPDRGEGEKILLVEDEEEVRTTTMIALKENRYEVVEAGSTKEALKLFQKEADDFRLAIVDIMLPDISGVELAEKLIKMRPEFKIILTSAYMENNSQMSVIKKRGFKFIEKPYNIYHLLKTVKETI